jgi:hypothetical protein
MRQFLPRLAICRDLEFSSLGRVLARLATAANRGLPGRGDKGGTLDVRKG